ncbi:hypothetical protein DCAR_0831353 [Daucus carota subsp. sativus]|uniref:Uncharacterized protein n=1 Tax=Daucus carota subsp. sativus TaxID=79200 RepID=A0A175YLC5_DAUCS|nr:hypothetical protein DCAR_0831353 [Daucus carota subsp. sativus]
MSYRIALIAAALLVALCSTTLTESFSTETMLDAGATRRFLGGNSHISYSALTANKVPCNQRGNSYYNCGATGKANPYHRGCTAATQCARH